MKLGLVDVGGGLRGIYGAGVLDKCLDNGIEFDYCIGVSAGSANICSYLSGQRGRNFKSYYTYSFRKQYMSLDNFLHKGSYFDLDYVYGDLSIDGAESPLDFAAFSASRQEFVIVASEAESGKVRYFTKADMHKNDFSVLKASSAIPVFCQPVEIDGIMYYDGGISDPVPVKKAFADGCTKVVLVLTRPISSVRIPDKDLRLAKILHRHYPMASHNLALRAKRYNDSVAYARELAKEGKLLILAPDDIAGVDTMKKTKDSLMRLYGKGYHDASAISRFIGV